MNSCEREWLIPTNIHAIGWMIAILLLITSWFIPSVRLVAIAALVLNVAVDSIEYIRRYAMRNSRSQDTD
jgi:uncharacterized paraquat-inducible protein A